MLRFVVSSALVTPAIMSLGCPSDASKPTSNPGPEPVKSGEEVEPHSNSGPEAGEQPETPAKTNAGPEEEEPHSNAGPQEDEDEPHSNAGPMDEPHSNAGPNEE